MLRFNAIAAGLVLAGSGAAIAAQDHRLAFSKAENIELFVEGATAENWCADALKLRVVHGGSYDPQALGRLLPKLGGLFSQQCPQAGSLTWRSVDGSGKALAHGTSRAEDGWQAVEAVAAAPEAKPVPETAVQQPEQADSTGGAQGGAAAPVQPKEADASQRASAPALEIKPVPEHKPVEASRPEAPLVNEAPAVTAQEAVQAGKPSTESAQATATPVPAPEAPPVPEGRAPRSLVDFAVGGWQPPATQQREALTPFLSTLQDQNGCNIVSVFNLGDQASYLNLMTEGVSCSAEGYAVGAGKLRLERSDGAQILRTGDLWFSNGLVFDKPVLGLGREDIVAARNGENIWFGLGSSAQDGSHYLLRADLGQFRGGIGVWQLRPQLDVLTSQAETFRQAAQIRIAVDRALAVLQEAMPDARSVRLVFSDDAEQGLWQRNSQHQLYAIDASRRYDYRTGKPRGEWQYNLQHAQNYLFQREARQAQEKRMQEERKERERQLELGRQARAERDNLRRYEQLRSLASQGTAQLRSQVERDINYQASSSGAYARLVNGGSDQLMRIVRVDGRKGDNATVDWPYPMQLLGRKDLKKGWYWINGTRRLDAAVLDDEDLPTSMVEVQDTGIRACEKADCADLLDPLAIVRMQLGKPDWTPEAAQALIDSAPKSLW